MLSLGSLTLGGRSPRVAIGFSDQITAVDVSEARANGVDVAEIRIDLFRSFDTAHVLKKLALFQGMPTVGTIRTASEGGGWKGTEEDRLKLFESILPHVDAVDIELSSLKTTRAILKSAHRQGKLVVISHHDFETTPDAKVLSRIVADARKAGADIIKIATHVADQLHVRSLASLLTGGNDSNLIVIGMGPQGLVTRLSFPALGSLMTFAALGSFQTAPGQISYSDMMYELRLLYPAYNEEKIIQLRLLESA